MGLCYPLHATFYPFTATPVPNPHPRQANARSGVAAPSDWRSPTHQLAALTRVAAQLAVQATTVLARAGGGRLAFEGDAWNGSSVDLIRAAKVRLVGGVGGWVEWIGFGGAQRSRLTSSPAAAGDPFCPTLPPRPPHTPSPLGPPTCPSTCTRTCHPLTAGAPPSHTHAHHPPTYPPRLRPTCRSTCTRTW